MGLYWCIAKPEWSLLAVMTESANGMSILPEMRLNGDSRSKEKAEEQIAISFRLIWSENTDGTKDIRTKRTINDWIYVPPFCSYDKLLGLIIHAEPLLTFREVERAKVLSL